MGLDLLDVFLAENFSGINKCKKEMMKAKQWDAPFTKIYPFELIKISESGYKFIILKKRNVISFYKNFFAT